MKIVTLLVLLVSDFDFLLTIISCMSYVFAAGIFYVFLALIGCFFMIYIGGCVIAARESTKFLERFKEKVESNEIAGISMRTSTPRSRARASSGRGRSSRSGRSGSSACRRCASTAPTRSTPPR